MKGSDFKTVQQGSPVCLSSISFVEKGHRSGTDRPRALDRDGKIPGSDLDVSIEKSSESKGNTLVQDEPGRLLPIRVDNTERYGSSDRYYIL